MGASQKSKKTIGSKWRNLSVLCINNFAIKGARITIKDYEKTAETDKDGKFEITPLSSGKYTVIVEREGYLPQTIKDVVIRTGVTSRLNVLLQAAA